MPNAVAMVCDRCGAPMETRRECEYCGTRYYSGPEVPEFTWLDGERLSLGSITIGSTAAFHPTTLGYAFFGTSGGSGR